MHSMSDMKLGHIGSKTRYQVKSKKNHVYTAEAQIKCNINETLPEYLSQLNLGQDKNLGHVR